MRRTVFILSALLLAGVNAPAATIGVYADEGASITQVTSVQGSPFTIYIVATDGPVDDINPSGLLAFDVDIVPSDNVLLSDWTYPDWGQNMRPTSRLSVAYPYPLTTGSPLVLATAVCALLDEHTGYIYVNEPEPCYGGPVDPFYISGDPEQIDVQIPLEIPVADYSAPVFTINNCSTPMVWYHRAGTCPSPRSAYAMVYDQTHGHAFLFGGKGPGVDEYYDDSWIYWNDIGWQEWVTSDQPGPRRYAAIAYDPHRGKIVLYGGSFGPVLVEDFYEDTWEFDIHTGVWAQIPVTGPGRLAYSAMVYDTARQVCVLYGGVVQGGRSAQTWEWDGVAWTRICDNCPPGWLAFHGMAYDEANLETILFGGSDPFGLRNATYRYKNGSWSLVANSGPDPRNYPALSYDIPCGGVVLYGGSTSTGPVGDLWKWQGNAWTLLDAGKTLSAGPRTSHTLVFNEETGGFFTFGGVDDTGTVLGDFWGYGPPPEGISVVDPAPETPAAGIWASNHPNPFNPQTTISFNLASEGHVTLTIFDIRGHALRVLVDEVKPEGENRITWNGMDATGQRVPSGIYLYRMVTQDGVFVGKMAALK